jgi:membrane protease YdiL (CAAX protease family)
MLVARLDARDMNERIAAANALGSLGSPEALAALAARLETPDRQEVVEAVMRALAAGGPETRPALERLRGLSESLDARLRMEQVLRSLDVAESADGPAKGELARQADEEAAPAPPRRRSRRALEPAPWGARDALLGLVIAQFPEIVPALITLLAGVTAASSAPTTARGVAAVVGTLVFDTWWIIWAWVFSLRRFSLRLSAWGFRRPPLAILWLVPLAVVISTAVAVVYGSFVSVPQGRAMGQFTHSMSGLVMFVVGACVLAPLFEETFFRGFLFQGLATWRGALLGAALSSALWSAGHLEPAAFVPIFVDGLLLCWVFRRSGSLWTNVAVHAAINAMAVIVWLH